MLFSCGLFDSEEKVSVASQASGSSSTIGQPSVGNGEIGSLSEYFYDFSSTINNKFQRFSLRDGSILNESLWSDEDTVNFFSYTEVLDITADNVDSYKVLSGLDESSGGDCVLGSCSGDLISLTKKECCINNGGCFSNSYECSNCTDDNDVDEWTSSGVEWIPNTELDINGNGLYEESEHIDSCQDLNGDGLLGLDKYEDLSVKDDVVIYASRFTDINYISWDKVLGRYVFSLNDDKSGSELISYVDAVDGECEVANCDVFDSLIYTVGIDSYQNTIDGYAFLDPNEWTRRDSIVYNSENVSFVANFSIDHNDLNRTYISPIYRKFSDCNDNGIWDEKEEVVASTVDGASSWKGVVDPASGLEETVWYLDIGNGVYDPAEPYYDENGSESWDGIEPYLNRNCNDLKIDGGPDDAEVRYDSEVECLSSDCETDCPDCSGSECSVDELECIKGACTPDDIGYFCDLPNGRWDDDEKFHDCGFDNLCVDEGDDGDQGEANGTWDCFDVDGNKINSDGQNAVNANFIIAFSCEGLFQVSQIPDNIIVDYTDRDNPVVKNFFGLGDFFDEKVGPNYHTNENLISEITSYDVKEVLKPDIDTIFTIYSNKVIENMGTSVDGEYNITKVKSQSTDPANAGLLVNEYAYNLFKISDSEVVKLVHPAYFLPDGYYSAYLDIVGSDNEQGTSDDGFWVQDLPSDETFIYSSNGMIRDGEYVYSIKNDTTDVGIYEVEEIYEVEHIESLDVPSIQQDALPGDEGSPVTYSDIFLVKKTVKMTLLGPGIKYIQQHKMYLAKDVGIIRDEVSFGWGQAASSSSEFSSEEFSRWDLIRSSQSSSEESGILRSLMSNSRK
ncbi:MAG: hypothetical protein CBD58_05145, partial [bacterium TMED198]